MTERSLLRKQCFPRPVAELFGFFADAHNLDVITPPWLKFRVLTPAPIEMRVGTLIDYRLRLHGLPIRWRTEITQWEPPYRFADNQLHGPYRRWFHEHIFEETSAGTQMTDRVTYRVPGSIFEPLIHDYFVERDLRRIFDYRAEQLAKRFG